MLLLFGYAFSFVVICLQAIPIDNGVLDVPVVHCEDEMIKMTFNTQRPFQGRIFVKGMADKKQCVMEYRGNTRSAVDFDLKNGDCNMRRQRKLGRPRSVEHSMTVIISFHSTFITKVDRAYRCTCFFMEADKVVSQQVEVSMIPTVDLVDTARMPICTYNVRLGSVNGPLVTYAKVGDQVYHVWQCDSDMFGMLVHNCYVDNGSGAQPKDLLDQIGCPVDTVILGPLTYNHLANQAFVESHVFKFADQPSVYFQCSISLCMKADGACVGLTPPVCSNQNQSNSNRTKREINERFVPEHRFMLADNDMDLSSTITVLEIDDSAPKNRNNKNQDFNTAQMSQSEMEKKLINENKVCLSPYVMGSVISVMIILTSLAVVTIAIQCELRRHHNRGPMLTVKS